MTRAVYGLDWAGLKLVEGQPGFELLGLMLGLDQALKPEN